VTGVSTAPTTRTTATTRGLVVLAAGLFALSLVTVSAPLDGDVRYEIGTQTTSPASAAGTFTHRPLMYRLIMSVLILPARAAADGVVWFERAMRLESLALACAAGLLLWVGLRRHWPEVAATLALTVTAALALLGPSLVLEPEWVAVVATVAGIGMALALPSRPPWGALSAVLGGLLFMVAAAVKVVTLPIAVIGLLALLLVDRRRCLIAMVAAGLGGLVYVGIVALAVPWEFQWMLDSAAMVPARGGPKVAAEAQVFLGNVAMIWPTVTLLPAALVGLPRTHLLAGTVAGLLAWLPVAIQNQYFVYHAAALPVLGAACLYGVLRRAGALFALPVLAVSGWTYYVLTTDPDWRVDHQPQLFTVAAVTAGVMVVLSLGWRVWRIFRPRSAGPRPVATLLATVILTATWLPAIAPTAAESVTLSTRDDTVAAHRRAAEGQLVWATSMRKRIGADTPVTYLTFGTTNYLLGNPSTCEFPTSVFLQRSRSVRRQEGTPTWRANLRCLTDKPGEVVVWDTQWFLLRRQPPEVRAAFAAAFDCKRGFTDGRIRVCPRRT
jgi:hypothetical protein